MTETQVDKKLALVNGDKCDKYDYLIAVFCGISAGLIDAFFVGAPGESVLGGATDNAADILVKRAAQTFWKLDTRTAKNKAMPESLTQCISYLEQAFPVNYDARYAKDLKVSDGVLSNMTAKNHHLLSLAHSPDIVGLIFSIVDQFTNMASFIDNGQIIRVYPLKNSNAVPYLQGTNLPSRLFCGFVNWIGHLLSDISGSSSTRQIGKTGRGMGVPIPFYELFLLCDFGDFDGKTFADIAVDVFNQGYDLRYGAAMAIPVLINDISVRLLWTVKRRAYHGYEWKKCIPTNRHSDLRCMLIVSEGALCFVDAADAAIRSGGNLIAFVLRLNLVAWLKLVLLILKEIAIRYGFTYDDLKMQFQKINAELESYLNKLKSIDYIAYEKELRDLEAVNIILQETDTNVSAIYSYLERMGVQLQFHSLEEMDEKMQDKSFVLEI